MILRDKPFIFELILSQLAHVLLQEIFLFENSVCPRERYIGRAAFLSLNKSFGLNLAPYENSKRRKRSNWSIVQWNFSTSHGAGRFINPLLLTPQLLLLRPLTNSKPHPTLKTPGTKRTNTADPNPLVRYSPYES
jgi:hypothetical protein